MIQILGSRVCLYESELNIDLYYFSTFHAWTGEGHVILTQESSSRLSKSSINPPLRLLELSLKLEGLA